MRRAGLLPVFALLILSVTGCARLLRQYDIAPNGLPRDEASVRSWLASGRADTAFARLARREAGPGDDLLRSLFLGVAAHYSGDYPASAAWLEHASYLSEERVTKSVSRSALSLISNDLILPYEPSRTERLFIPYYAALGRLRLGDVQGAAVEARRLSSLLERYERQKRTGDDGLYATLRYFAATVFDAAGEANDAAVAYRNAAALAEGLVLPGDTAEAWSTAHTASDEGAGVDSGNVVVFIEHGYVAHRTGQALHVLLTGEEVYAFGTADGERRATLASLIADRVIENRARSSADETRYCYAIGACFADGKPKPVTKQHNGEEDDDDQEDHKPYLLKIAWPVMRQSLRSSAQLTILSAADGLHVHDLGDVSGAVIADFEAERGLILARTIARGALKAALTRAAEKKAEKKDDDAGRLVGMLANVGGVLLEQADTRSWHLLPGRVSVARLRLPTGTQEVTLNVNGEPIDLGRIEVPVHGVAIAASRLW